LLDTRLTFYAIKFFVFGRHHGLQTNKSNMTTTNETTAMIAIKTAKSLCDTCFSVILPSYLR
jgi:hypothetical protein